MNVYVFRIATRNTLYRFTTTDGITGTLESLFSSHVEPFVEHGVAAHFNHGTPLIGERDGRQCIRTSNVTGITAQIIEVPDRAIAVEVSMTNEEYNEYIAWRMDR